MECQPRFFFQVAQGQAIGAIGKPRFSGSATNQRFQYKSLPLGRWVGKTNSSQISTWNSKQPVFLWLVQLDDSKSLHKKRLEITKDPLKKWLFRVPGR